MNTRALIVVAGLMLMVSCNPGLCQDSLEREDRSLMDIGWAIRARQDLTDGYWLIERHTNRIVGWAIWDGFQRRYTFFDRHGKYAGFMQAMTLVKKPYSFHRQYAVYDENNEYRGFSVRELGGFSIQHIHPTPFGVPSLEPPLVPKREIGGELLFYPRENTPLAPPDFRIRFFPWDIEQILDQMELPSATGR
jgi:hypothetical protein